MAGIRHGRRRSREHPRVARGGTGGRHAHRASLVSASIAATASPFTRTRTQHRVAITGIGCVTPIGTGVDALWAGLRAERSAVTAIDRFDASIFRSRCNAAVPGLRRHRPTSTSAA